MKTRGAPGPALLAAALGMLCGCPDEPPPEIVKNSCLTNLNCGGEDEICEQSTLMCVRLKTVEPYRVVLQVQPATTRVELPEAGSATLVAQAAFERGSLDAGVEDALLEIPEAVRKQGRVRGLLDGGMNFLASELTLTPRMNEAELRATVVNSAKTPENAVDGGVQVNVDVQLDRDLKYDLHVQPLLSPSTKLPPYRSTTPYDPNQPLNVEIAPVGEQSARLFSLDRASWANQRVRLEEKATGQVVSSIEEVQSLESDAGVEGGRFTLFADPGVFSEASKYNLVVGLDAVAGTEFPRWRIKLIVDATRFISGNPNPVVNLPSVPPPVRVKGIVVRKDPYGPLASAELEFVSDFPWEEGYVGPAHWCSLLPNQPSPGLSCKARLNTRSDPKGNFEIDLLPGRYRMFVQPDRTASPDRGTYAEELLVEMQTDTPQDIVVSAATEYAALVRSPQHQPMPNVTFSARALGVAEPGFNPQDDPKDLDPELAKYNRSTSVVTNARGEFSLFPDIGRYDFSVETPSESGFAWMLCPDYVIEPRDPPERIELRSFYPPHPVILGGTVEHSGVKLSAARIEAYAVWNTDPPRLLLVGRAVSDAEGKFRLAMPPQLPPTDPKKRPLCPIDPYLPESASSMDAGVDAAATATSDSALSER